MKQLLINAESVRLLFDRRNRLQHIEVRLPEKTDAPKDQIEKRLIGAMKEDLNPEFSQPTIGIL